MASGKTWNRRAAVATGVALAAGSYFALQKHAHPTARTVPDAKTFRRGNAAEPQTLDPALSSGVQEFDIITDLLVGLMTSDPDGKPIPGMATRWQTSEDGLTWTFYLREAVWSDGKPVSAHDFVFGWQRLVDPATAATYAYFLYLIKNAEPINAGKLPVSALGVTALNDRTFQVQLEHPAPYFLQMLTHTTTYPLPRHVVMAKGKDWALPGRYVGNGPFLLKEWIPNGHVLVVKNPRFYDAEHVQLERVFFYPTDDYGAALDRFRAGELDFQDRLPPEQIDWIRKNIPETIDPIPQLIAEFLAVNLRRKPFDDIRVRAAMNLALNREAITKRITRVGNVAAYCLVPPRIANYPDHVHFDFESMPFSQRVEKARRLMQSAGFNDNNRVNTTFMIRATTAGAGRATAAAIQQMFAQIYLDISIVPNDMKVFYPTIQIHDFDIAQAGWVADFNDASTFLNLFRSDSGDNWGQYNNPAYDRMLASAQQDRDIVSRGQKLAKAEAILVKDQVFMPLFFWSNANLVWPYVKGFKANAMNEHRSRWVWIDQKAREARFA